MARKREAKEKRGPSEKTYKYKLPDTERLMARNVASSINKKTACKRNRNNPPTSGIFEQKIRLSNKANISV